MPSLKLTDNYGFSMDASDGGGGNSSFLQRLLSDAQFVFDTANLKTAGPLPVGGQTAPNLPFTLSAKGSAGIGVNGIAALEIAAGCTAKLSRNIGDECSELLKPFGADLPDGCDRRVAGYLTFETKADVSAAASGKVEEFTFGLTASESVILSNSRFDPQLASTRLADATRSLLAGLQIPMRFDDLKSLPTRYMYSVSGKGSLKFKASAGYQFFTNPLTSVALPFSQTLAVKAVGNADLTFAVTVTAGFKVSVLKADEYTVRLAVERSRGTDFDTGVEIKADLTASVMGQDTLSLILGAVSPDPQKELKQINARLDDNERDAVNGAIKCAIQDNFELAAQAEIENTLGTDSVLLYEVDLRAVSEDGKAALESAFRGDFSKLPGTPGITEKRSIFTTTKDTAQRLTVHLLNVLQAGRVAEVISKQTVSSIPGGDVIITDKATAQKTDFLNLSDKAGGLRNVLFTSAMITSAYKAMDGALGAPETHCELVHFEYQKSAAIDDLRRNLNALEMLQVVSNEQAATALDTARKQKPAPSSTTLRLRLSAADCMRLFLENDRPRSQDSYETVAKSAMYKLIANDPSQADLAKLFTPAGSALWNELKESGNVSSVPDAQRYAAEFYRVSWWAQHMAALANCVAEFQANGGSEKLRQKMNSEAQQVSSLSEDYFNVPWGILAVSQVLGFSPKAEVTYVSQPFSIALANIAAGAAHFAGS